jgi:hypothetical protein
MELFMSEANYTTPTEKSLFPDMVYRKTKKTFSIGEDVMNDFKLFTKEFNIEMSGTIEILIKNFMLQNRNEWEKRHKKR